MKKLLVAFLLLPTLIFGQCAGNQSFALTPAPTNGNYEPGTVVTMCYTMNGWDTGFGSNWIEGFGITLGPGWVSYVPISGPDDCGGASLPQQWYWLESATNNDNTLTVGPGYFYEGPTGPIDGNPGNDWGDFGTNCLWIFCIQLQVSDECDPLSLLIEVTPYADGTMGSWGNLNCFDPPFQVFNGTIAGGDVDTSPISIPTDTICVGSTQTYSVTNTPGSTYDWELLGGGTLAENGTNSIIVDWGGVPGDYTITVQETTVDGCIGDVIDTTITVADTLITFSQPTTGICLGDTLQLHAIPDDGYWSGGNLTNNVYTGNEPGYHFVKYTANIYGCNVTDSIRVFVREPFLAPTISGLEYINLCLLDRTQTYYTIDDPSIEYTWLMGNETLLDTDYDLQISWPDSTLSYTLEVFGTDTIGCKSEIGYLNVSVKACHRIFVPNSFTPNGDSYNDAFKIAGSAVYDLDFKIYNRFGDNIWSITSINEYWNGNDGNGYYCPTGIYNWVAKYSDDEGFKHVEKGHILLIR